MLFRRWRPVPRLRPPADGRRSAPYRADRGYKSGGVVRGEVVSVLRAGRPERKDRGHAERLGWGSVAAEIVEQSGARIAIDQVRAAGSAISSFAPPSGRLLAEMVPPCWVTIPAATVNPNPVPRESRRVVTKASKISGSTSAGMPWPLSSTVMVTQR